jgi:hypothetical protein
VLLLAGCGGGNHQSPAERAVASALQGYLSAFSHGNYGAACARLTEDAKEKIARRARTPNIGVYAATCPAQLRGIVNHVPRPQRQVVFGVIGKAKIENIRIAHGTATASVKASFHGQAQDQPVNLLLVGNAWKVDASPNPR